MHGYHKLAFCYSLVSTASERLIRWRKRREPNQHSLRSRQGAVVPYTPLSFSLSTFNKVFPHLTERSLPQNINLQSSILLPLRPSVCPSISKSAVFFYPSVHHCSLLSVFHSFLCHICDHPSIFLQQNLQHVRIYEFSSVDVKVAALYLT